MSTPYNPENSSNPDFGSTPDYGSTPSSSGAENTGSGAHSAPGNYGSSDSFGSYGASSAGASNSGFGASNNSGFGASNTSASTGAASTGQNSTSTGAANTNSGFGSYGAADTSNASAATGSFAQTSQQPNYGDQYGQQQYGQTQSSQAQRAQFGQGQAQNQNFGAGAFPQDAQAAAGKKKDGFFGALFDFEFRRFVTIDFVKIIYIIYLVFAALMWVGGLIVAFGGFAKGAGIGLLMLIGWLIFGTLWALFQVVISRVMLEVLVSVVRIAQNTTELVDQGEARK